MRQLLLGCGLACYAIFLCISTVAAGGSASTTQEKIADGIFTLYKVKASNANQLKILLGLNSHPGDEAVIFLDLLHIGKSSLVLIHPSNGSTYEAIFNQHGIKYSTKGETAIQSISTIQQYAAPEPSVPQLRMGAAGFAKSNTKDLIEKMGYPVETHEVTTEDGYILTYYRIPHGKHNPGQGSTKGPVMLQHGMQSSSFSFFIQDEEKILPFMLAEDGYDVWIGNSRGTSYSQKHVNTSSSTLRYWRFSWDEMGVYDIPAAIDYILGKTSKQQLHYIGFSMGTTQFFVMSSLRPEYNAKIKLMTAYAPVAYLANINGPLKVLSKVASKAKVKEDGDVETLIGDKVCELPKLVEVIYKYGNYKCPSTLQSRQLCHNALYVVNGLNERETNDSRIEYIIENIGDISSLRTYVHYGQQIRHQKFARFDFGKRQNLKKYGTETPPSYDSSEIKVPIAMYWGPGDAIAHPKDIDKFSKELPQVVRNYKVPEDGFNHLDFMAGTHAYELVYKPTLEFMNQQK